MKYLPRILAPILIALTFSVMFFSTSFAGIKYVCDIGQFGDGSPGISQFGLDIQSNTLFRIKDVGKSYAKSVRWKKLEQSEKFGATQTLYSDTKEWRHMMVIQTKEKPSVEVHTWEIRFDVDSIGQAQEKYGIEHYPMFHFTKCVGF